MNADRPRIDSRLRRQLDSAGPNDSLEAVLTLRAGGGSSDTPSAEAVVKRAEALVRQAAADAEIEPDDYELNVFGQLEAFAIAAPRRLVERLLADPEVASAMPNRPSPPGSG